MRSSERLEPTSEAWAALVEIAIEQGYSTEEIAQALLGDEFGTFNLQGTDKLREDLEVMAGAEQPIVVAVAREANRLLETWTQLREIDW